MGQTLFCVHPTEMRNAKPLVGGTKNVKLDRVDALSPDLIIANKEEIFPKRKRVPCAKFWSFFYGFH